MSEPVASVAAPAASAAAAPPLEPPGEYAVFHGLRVTPHSFVQVNGAQENSGVVDRACTMPPASMMRRTKTAVWSATTSRSGTEPSVLRWPSIGASSFTATGKAPQRSRLRAAARVPGLGIPGLVHRLLVAGLGERVDGRLDRLRAGDHRRHQLGGGQLAGPEQAQRLSGGQVVQVGHARGCLLVVGGLLGAGPSGRRDRANARCIASAPWLPDSRVDAGARLGGPAQPASYVHLHWAGFPDAPARLVQPGRARQPARPPRGA